MPFYVNGKNINIGRTSDNFATSAAAILTEDPARPTGWYYIKASGMANAQLLWCDMESGNATTGRGFMRFWWHGTFEQDGRQPPSWYAADVFANADLSTDTAPTTNFRGYYRIPSGVTPSFLLVKGWSGHINRNTPQYNGFYRKLPYCIWQFDDSNSTALRVRQSMQSGTDHNAVGDNWQPIVNESRNSSFPYANNDYWYYHNKHGGGYRSMHLDDDSGWHNTAFGAGVDGSGGTGVDCFSGQSGSEQRAYYDLVLFWK